MENFKNIWKTLSAAKAIQPKHMVTYGILRAMAAKSPNKNEIARYFVAKAFSKPGRHRKPFYAAELAADSLYWDLKGKKLLGVDYSEIFSSEEEVEQFKEILKSLAPYDFDRHYTYVFVRQDIFEEYQLVQAAHATMVAGQRMDPKHKADQIYYTVVGVKDHAELFAVSKELNSLGFKHEMFYEPDINSSTAIATHPIHWIARRPLMKYSLLTFKKPELADAA